MSRGAETRCSADGEAKTSAPQCRRRSGAEWEDPVKCTIVVWEAGMLKVAVMTRLLVPDYRANFSLFE